MNKSRLCQSKSYSGHVSFVNQIEMDSAGDLLFTSGINDECVFQWKVNKSKKYWEMDHLDYDINREDVFFAEVEPQDKFTTIIEQLLPIRDEVIELQQTRDETYEAELYLELAKVIGRRSYNRRNNVFFTENNQLVFSAGSVVVSLKIPPEGVVLDNNYSENYFS